MHGGDFTLDYPGGFETPAFPAGRSIAATRLVSIITMVLFFLIIVMCGFLFWANRSVHIHPFLVSVNNITGAWTVVGHHHSRIPEMTTDRSLQESVLSKFVSHWFWISASDAVNTAMWKSCERETECNPDNKTGIEIQSCSIYCMSGEGVYSNFIENVVPGYQTRVSLGETWLVDSDLISFTPLGEINASGGSWLVNATVYSSTSGQLDIMAYATVSRDLDSYPQTLGYYVSTFNAYKMN